jgi:hypothetical protein
MARSFVSSAKSLRIDFEISISDPPHRTSRPSWYATLGVLAAEIVYQVAEWAEDR